MLINIVALEVLKAKLPAGKKSVAFVFVVLIVAVVIVTFVGLLSSTSLQ